MFSGSNPSADLYWANALAQSQSQNNSLDWALLAQQWISHQQNITTSFDVNTRDSIDFVNPADAPPAPKIVIKNNEEQGEADMDVEDDSPDPPSQNFIQSQPPPQIWSIATGTPVHMQIIPQHVPPTTINSAPWNIWNTPGLLNTNLPPPTLHIPELSSGPMIGNDKINKPPIIPSLMDTPVNAPNDQFPALDAAKRKTLPAWIREGLEKMEREKQKQLEKEKIAEVTDNKYDNQSFIESLQTADNIGSSRINKISSNYKGFLKNSAASSDESNESDSESENENLKKDTQIKTNPWHGKTREEIEEEMMLVVRRSLTEILLEITNDEIRNIAQETFKRHKLKASSAQVIRKSALTSISGNLGLGAYDSDSSNNSDTDDEISNKDDKEYDKDSEDEIREKMISRQRAFKSIAREIDILVEKEEARQEEIRLEHLRREQLERSSERLLSHGGDNDINNDHSSNGGRNSGNYIGNSSGVENNVTGQLRRTHYDREFGETHHDKKSYSSNGQKRLKERTSRFSDNKESKNKPSSSSSNSSAAGYLLSTSTNALNSTNLLNSTTSSTNKLLHHQQPSTSSIGSSAQILSNSAAQNFLMANEVLSKAFSKNDKKKFTLSSTSSNKRNKRDKKSRSRSRSRSSNKSSSSNNSDEKSSHSSRSSKTSSSSNTSNSSQTKKLKHKKSREPSNEFDKESKQNRYHHKNNDEDDDDRLDSGEYNHGRSQYYHNYHHSKTSNRRSHSSDDDRSSIRDDERSSSRNYYDNKYTGSINKKYDRTAKESYKDRDDNDDEDYRRQKRQHDNSPDSDDYYRSSRHRYTTNSGSSRSSSHRNEKKDYYSKTSNRDRKYSRREDNSRSRSRSKSKSKSYSSKDKHY